MARLRRSPRATAVARPIVEDPSRRQTLALALLADVEPRIAKQALQHGAGAIAGDAGHRIAIAMSAMRLEPPSLDERATRIIAAPTPEVAQVWRASKLLPADRHRWARALVAAADRGEDWAIAIVDHAYRNARPA